LLFISKQISAPVFQNQEKIFEVKQVQQPTESSQNSAKKSAKKMTAKESASSKKNSAKKPESKAEEEREIQPPQGTT